MWWLFWPAVIIPAFSSFGTAHAQLRTACNAYVEGGALAVPCESAPLNLEDLRRQSQKSLASQLRGAAIERLFWNAPTAASGTTARQDFTIGIAEFDDQGNAWSRGEIAAVKHALTTTLQQRNAIVVIFIHGWKNNCEACNGNLSCFRETLALLSALEQELAATATALARRIDPAAPEVKPRHVFGLYVAWRGLTARTEPGKEISVFGRKAVADRIGSRGGDLTSLLAWVDATTAPTGRAAVPQVPLTEFRTMTAMIGHSFGADLLFGAVSTTLDARIAASTTTGSAGRLAADPIGDVLVLLNPAFEASTYRRFSAYAEQPWDPKHLPVLLTVQARNDWATHYTFPITRTLSTLPQESGTAGGYRELLDAVGHHRPFFTHTLDLANPPKSVEMEAISRKPGREPCACNGTRASAATLKELTDSVLGIIGQDVGATEIGAPLRGEVTYLRPCLRSATSPPPRQDAPFMLIRTDPEIVNGHSGITRVQFVEFVVNFLVRVDQLRHPQTFAEMARAAAAQRPPGAAAAAAAPPAAPVCQ